MVPKEDCLVIIKEISSFETQVYGLFIFVYSMLSPLSSSFIIDIQILDEKGGMEGGMVEKGKRFGKLKNKTIYKIMGTKSIELFGSNFWLC